MELQFSIVDSHEECTHFLIEDEDAERLNAIGVQNGKLYNLFYDKKADEHFIVNEDGVSCVDIEILVQVKMLRQHIS